MSEISAFDKYDNFGPYHWQECDRRYLNYKKYNPALEARYELTARRIQSLGIRDSMLDAGCGDGYLTARLAPMIARVVGVDSETNAIRWAKEKLHDFPNCEPMHIDCYDLPFEDETFDLVTSADVIEHLKDPADHLKEICRVVKRSGVFVLTTPKWRPDGKWDERHAKEYRPDELRLLLQAYFDEVEMSYFWPLKWSKFYETRIGWRFLKLLAIQLYNPFLRVSSHDPEKFGQIMAICHQSVPA